jgi:hypothetical protein
MAASLITFFDGIASYEANEEATTYSTYKWCQIVSHFRLLSLAQTPRSRSPCILGNMHRTHKALKLSVSGC